MELTRKDLHVIFGINEGRTVLLSLTTKIELINCFKNGHFTWKQKVYTKKICYM